jgi:hypothetical protein
MSDNFEFIRQITSEAEHITRDSKCVRCGACCIMGPCPYGEEDLETGACKYLYFEGDKAVCPFVESDKPEIVQALKIGYGCVMRGKKTSVEEYLDEKVKTYRRYKNI